MIDAKSYGPWAIIAGASEGIGVSFAHQLGRAGINLILVARQKNLLEELAREVCGKSPVQVRVLPLDLTRTDVLAACPAGKRRKR
jgi:short-subunit dehydrogenase